MGRRKQAILKMRTQHGKVTPCVTTREVPLRRKLMRFLRKMFAQLLETRAGEESAGCNLENDGCNNENSIQEGWAGWIGP